jgi:hypothetical protein
MLALVVAVVASATVAASTQTVGQGTVLASAAVAASTQTVGPGTVLLRVRQSGPSGPIKAYVLRVDLADPAVRAGLLYPGAIAAVRTV